MQLWLHQLKAEAPNTWLIGIIAIGLDNFAVIGLPFLCTTSLLPSGPKHSVHLALEEQILVKFLAEGHNMQATMVSKSQA